MAQQNRVRALAASHSACRSVRVQLAMRRRRCPVSEMRAKSDMCGALHAGVASLACWRSPANIHQPYHCWPFHAGGSHLRKVYRPLYLWGQLSGWSLPIGHCPFMQGVVCVHTPPITPLDLLSVGLACLCCLQAGSSRLSMIPQHRCLRSAAARLACPTLKAALGEATHGTRLRQVAASVAPLTRAGLSLHVIMP